MVYAEKTNRASRAPVRVKFFLVVNFMARCNASILQYGYKEI
jgi:hypothetical protein